MMKKILFLLSALVCTMAWAETDSSWTRSGNASLQFTQGFVSKNWYKGGESNFSLLATADYTFNYKVERFSWDNKIEAKLGFVSTPSDQYHNYLSNNDLLKWTTKLGYEAKGNWYYTLQAIGQTQFCTGFKANDRQEYSKFFNPAYANVSVGMDWKKSTEKLTCSVFIGPFAYNLKFVSDPQRNFRDVEGVTLFDGRIDGTQFGLHKGDFNLYDFGASAKAVMTWKVCKYLTWNSQATYFSPVYDCGKYKGNVYTELDWENTFDMPLNKFFSTKIYTHLRFDDSVGPANKAAGWNYFQFTELLSFGISYNW